ncbi:MAG: peptidase [Acidobacteria bacterium]|nr:MAG: peptidase [Acidobacteriota bacterium]REJ97978.1 MAG: peptidase [Acidobacteriota bacterium]REK16721.1 MAG: peptidase [Acidobacteriota bacterium]REK42632.1 MAG: peptidase [Acidobacteriota bacterium]
MKIARFLCVVALIVGLVAGFPASVLASGDEIPATLGGLPVDMESSKAIRDATTEERFLTPLVSAIPDHATIPSPRDFLGYIAGAPGEMTNVAEIHGYYRAIAEATGRAKVISLGKTAEGREMIALFIADEETIADLDSYVAKLNALSDPRKTNSEEAAKIIATAKPIYWITAGLHSTEFGPPETSLEIAYRLAAEERPIFREIRKNVITMITPVFEVDGRNRSTEWFHKHGKGHTNAYDRPPTSPPFWGKYTFHDNNRDGIGLSQPMTKNFLRGFLKYKPTLSLDLHESVPYLYVATGTGPYNPMISPTTIGEWGSIANYEVSRLTAMGLPGVWTWGFYTGWFPGYMLWVTNNRNSNGRFYETFGNGSSETMMRDLGDSRYAGEKVIDRTWYRPSPPDEEVKWSMRNNLNYMSSGVYVSLEYAARNKTELVENFYNKSANSVRKGKEKAPYAIVIPNEQRDPGATRELIDLTIEHGIEISKASEDGEFGDLKVKKGDAVIRLDQPYGPLAKGLYEKQDFPQDAQVPPYDDVAWTLGLIRGVDVKMADDKAVLELDSKLASSGSEFYGSSSIPSSKFYAVRHKGQEGIGELRFALPGASMKAAAEEVKAGDEIYPAGTIFIDASTVDRNALGQVVSNTLLEVERVSEIPKGKMIEIDVPRIGMLHSWTSTQNAGWVRFTLDQSKVPYSIIEKSELKAGNLRAKYDVILAPHFGRSLRGLITGVDKKWSPLAYETTDKTPSHGKIVSSSDITGGYGFEGLAALDKFINSGGTFVGLGTGGTLVVDSGIVPDVAMSSPGINTPGSVITMKIVDKTSPLTFGYDEFTHAFRGNLPLLRVGKDETHLVAAQFGTDPLPKRPWNKEKEKKKEAKSPPLVLSGVILSGRSAVDGAPAIISASVGRGQVVLLGWNPMHRHLNHHDHAFVYNALMFWNDLRKNSEMP